MAWREHYKKNQDKFDPIINEMAKKYPANHPGLYELNRNFNGKKRVYHEIMEEEEDIWSHFNFEDQSYWSDE